MLTYDSIKVSGGLSAFVPLLGNDYLNVTSNLGYKGIHNDYASTEQTQSGLYAGSGGLNVNVDKTITMTGGVMTTTVEAGKSQVTASNIIANDCHLIRFQGIII